MSKTVTVYGNRRDGRGRQRLKIKASSVEFVCETLSDSPFFRQVVAEESPKRTMETKEVPRRMTDASD